MTLPAATQPEDLRLFGSGPQSPRLRTLVRLRWLAVVGQAAAVLSVHVLLGFPLPLGWCLALIALSAWLNIFISLRWRPTARVADQYSGILLVYDVLQLAALLFLTGGLENPFAFLFLVPVTVSATSLPIRWTVWLGVIAFLCATLLAYLHLPLPWFPDTPLVLPQIYVGGMWAALISGVVFSALYARRISEEAQQMSAALSATEMVLAREQRLSALDGLAAAAAHELGTPLATIALVAKELKREMGSATAHAEDIDLLISQAARCRDILSTLANRDSQTDAMFAQVTVPAMLEDIVAPLRGSDVVIAIDAGPLAEKAPANAHEPVMKRNPAISFALGNLLENAVDFANGRVDVVARWSGASINVTVRDDGPGFAQDIIDRLGDPFVTSRPGYQDGEVAAGHEGMGLGFFIAKTLLERSGATVTLANRPPPDHGAAVSISWSRQAADFAAASMPNIAL